MIRKQELLDAGFNLRYFAQYWKAKNRNVYLQCKACGSKKIEKIRTDTVAAQHGVVTASPLESHAQDKCNQYYVDLGVFFRVFSIEYLVPSI